MTRVAAIIGFAISTMVAATLLLHSSREQSAWNQALAQQQELAGHLLRIEQALSALGRGTDVAANLQPSSSARSAPHDNSSTDTAKADATSGERAVQEQAVRDGNEIVERAIANGVVSPADFNALANATRELSADQRMQMLSKLTVAINTDRVQFDRAWPSR
jgi:hypothetical protein